MLLTDSNLLPYGETLSKKNMISLEKVCLTNSITNEYLIKDISLELKQGDRLAIIGASGAGKTTLLRLLNCLISPTSGSLQFKGEDYGLISPVILRRQVMLVSQEVRLLEMTVQEALAYPLVLEKLPSAKVQETLDYWIEKFHIPKAWLERTEQQLSLGQRQWVGICRALVLQPPVLLLDEPTSALDQGRAEDLLQILLELNQQHQTTILMVNHQLPIAQEFATRIIYLQQGELMLDQSSSVIDWGAIARQLQAHQQQLNQAWAD